MKLPIYLTDAASHTASSLHCPICGGYNLHQHNVVVYTGLCPDYSQKLEQEITVFENGMVSAEFVNRDSLRNPSSRRDGIRISMTCEHCSDDPANPEDAVPDLLIYQHKGTTYIEWDSYRLAPRDSLRLKAKDGL